MVLVCNRFTAVAVTVKADPINFGPAAEKNSSDFAI
jgi:hypothetical protein